MLSIKYFEKSIFAICVFWQARCTEECGNDLACSLADATEVEDATNLMQVRQSLSLGSNRSATMEDVKQQSVAHSRDGKYCKKSSLRINQFNYYCSYHVSDQDGMGTDGITAHANNEKLHIQGVLSLKGRCTTLLTHAIQLFEKDLETMGVLRIGRMTLDFAPDKANKACSCYTKAAQDLGFRKLTFDEAGLAHEAKGLHHSSKRWTNGFPLDCFAFPLGAAESSGFRTRWDFSDRTDADLKNMLNVGPADLRSGREKIMDHAQFVVGGEPSEDPSQLPAPRLNADAVTPR